jgi:glutamate synthase domain-containing protein 3
MRLEEPEEMHFVQSIINKHLNFTQSQRAHKVLMNWNAYLPLFWKVVPKFIPLAEAEADDGTDRKAVRTIRSPFTQVKP